eukprot:19238_3
MRPGPSALVSDVSLGFWMIWSIGIRNAAVLPEPVSAIPMRSRFCTPMGIHCIIGKGFLYPALSMAENISRGSDASLQE